MVFVVILEFFRKRGRELDEVMDFGHCDGNADGFSAS